jgi:hypothetical protein
MAVLSHKERKRRNAIRRMAGDWEIDTQNYEIRIKEKPWYINLWYRITLKRYTVRELYIYVYDHFHHPSRIAQLMPIEIPLEHDKIKKPPGVPTNFVMQGGWEIPPEFAKKIIKGPLISEDGSTLIVKTDSHLDILVRILLRIIGWLGIPGGLYGTWQAIKSL